MFSNHETINTHLVYQYRGLESIKSFRKVNFCKLHEFDTRLVQRSNRVAGSRHQLCLFYTGSEELTHVDFIRESVSNFIYYYILSQFPEVKL